MAPMRIKPKKHIVWFHDREIDLSDPTEALRYYEQVLTHGRAEDIRELDLTDVRKYLPDMKLPRAVRHLWEDYFHAFRKKVLIPTSLRSH
jgi:hypothetical protein